MKEFVGRKKRRRRSRHGCHGRESVLHHSFAREKPKDENNDKIRHVRHHLIQKRLACCLGLRVPVHTLLRRCGLQRSAADQSVPVHGGDYCVIYRPCSICVL